MRSIVLVGLLAVVACGGGISTSDPLATPSTDTAPPPASPPSTGPTATSPGSTAAPGTTQVSCEPEGGTAQVSVDFPETMSALAGKDIRTGAQPCADRVVIELQTIDTGVSDAFPGYRLEYVAEPILLTAGEAKPYTVAGDATLLVTMNAWLTTMEGAGYNGPLQIFPTNVEHIEEVRILEMFEGVSVIGIGLDRERPFTARVLDQRLIIDFSTAD